MKLITGHVSMYVFPPLLSLATGWTLALISLIKGKFRSENILFALVCIWWTLMPVIYISHHLFRGNLDLILSIERCIHFFYVYVPFIVVLYLKKSFGLNSRLLLAVSLLQSIIISAFVPTRYYISGFYTYEWGYSAIGGPAFRVFGASAMFYTVFAVVFFIKKIRTSLNRIERLKLVYILSSFIATAILMILNMPSIIGINFYAFGNFMFIPLLLIAYGVLRYRLMDIKSVLHITLIWTVISSLIIIPNIYIFIITRPLLPRYGDTALFLFLIIWFMLNYYYFVKIKPVIDRFFNRQKFNLLKSESEFIENISLLKNAEELTGLFTGTLRRILSFRNAELFLRDPDGSRYKNSSGEELVIDAEIYSWLLHADAFISLDIVHVNPDYEAVREKLSALFRSRCSFHIIPFVYNRELTGIAFIDERINMKPLSAPELKFLSSIRSSVSISISNSVMYQSLSDLKDTLEDKVIRRTEELLNTMQRVEEINRELVDRNTELSEARRIAELDMSMAVNVQKSIFPPVPANDSSWDAAAAVKPMSGVSGDIYDLYTAGDALKGLILLDVSGHGIASGLITMIARSVFYRNFFLHMDHELGRIMESANEELIREISNSEKYLTGILLRLDDAAVEYANAGHPDMLIKRKSTGTASRVNHSDEIKGGLLGISGMENRFMELKLPMESGDIIVLFSDGAIEAADPAGNRFGFQGMEKSLEECAMERAEDVLNRLMQDLYAFTGTDRIGDDLTMIVLVKK